MDQEADEFEKAWKVYRKLYSPSDWELRLVKLIGPREAFDLFEAFGGTRLFVPFAVSLKLSEKLEP